MRSLLAAAIVLLCVTSLQAAPLILPSGSLTFDTDTLQMTGSAAATGAVFGGAAVFDFDAVDLGSGVNVTLQGSRPLQLLSYSNLSLNTTLQANGGTGQSNTSVSGQAGFGGTGILGAGDGGRAGQGNGVDGTNGQGPGAGGGQLSCCGGGTGAGYGGVGGNTHDPNPSIPQGPTYGDVQVTNLLGGSGGGGGAGDTDNGSGCCFQQGSGGGAGGGAIGLSALGNLTLGVSGEILVDGGGSVNGRSGGGGSGGSIRLSGDNVTLQSGSVLSAQGGSSATTGSRSGGGGGGGRIAVFSGSSLTNNGAIDVSPGVGFSGSTTPLAPAQPGTTFNGASDGLVSSLNLGTGTFQLTINTDLGAMAYSGDRVGFAPGEVNDGIATFNLDSIDLGSGVSVVLEGDNPLSLRTSGPVTIDTTIDASGGDGSPRSGASGGVGGTAPGGEGLLGGGDGGRGGLGTGSTPGLPGEGPGGGGGQTSCCGGGSGGGFGGEGGLPNTDTAAAQPAGAIYGEPALEVLQAGSGGGGGAGTNSCCPQGGGGGAGGGALEIIATSGWITIGPNGQILLEGGDGDGVGSNARTGGGGSGGGLKLFSLGGISVDGLLSADGGLSHLTSARGGGGGGGGRIALFAPQVLLGGIGQSEGLLSSGAFASALGGPGSSNSAGGNPGGNGTIFFNIVPEPSTLLVWSLLASLGVGLGWRRRP